MLPSPKYHKHIAMNRRDFETMLIGLAHRMDDPKAPKEDRAVCSFLILRLDALPYEMERKLFNKFHEEYKYISFSYKEWITTLNALIDWKHGFHVTNNRPAQLRVGYIMEKIIEGKWKKYRENEKWEKPPVKEYTKPLDPELMR